MKNINTVCLSGNVVRDAESRHSGTPIVTFSIAVNESRKDQSGNWVESTNYVDCVLFGKLAESMMTKLMKGVHVLLSGSIRQSSWEKDGQKHSKLEVIVRDIEVQPRAQAAQQKASWTEEYYN